ncbi:MAG: hypothetical protein OEZ36_10325, partial [Spirochaetota bacterium]|nr:hypothetical protein [Spirochaetota bacterium]
MILTKIIPAILLVVSVLSCGQQVNVLRKQPFQFEINLKHTQNSKDINVFQDVVSLRSPPSRFLNNRLYFRSNKNKGFILRVDIQSGNALMIASKYSEPEINLIEKDNNPMVKNNNPIKEKIKVKVSKYLFHYIADFCPNGNNDMYVFNVEIPKDEKLKPTAKRYQGRALANRGQSNTPVKVSNRFILKFNEEGKFLYKLGSTGKNGRSFDPGKSIVKMVCDQDDNLFLILRSAAKYDNNGKLVTKIKHEIYKFSPDGNRIYHHTNIKSYLPQDNKYIYLIDDLDISSNGEEILVLLSYYKKDNGKKDKGLRPIMKKIYSIKKQRNQFVARLIRELNKSGKYYSFFAMNPSGNIILNIPDTDKKDNMNFMTYRFQVLDKEGNYQGIKKLYL